MESTKPLFKKNRRSITPDRFDDEINLNRITHNVSPHNINDYHKINHPMSYEDSSGYLVGYGQDIGMENHYSHNSWSHQSKLHSNNNYNWYLLLLIIMIWYLFINSN